MNTLIAYFSKSGRTKRSAEQIAKIIDSDLYEIKTIKQYPKNYFRTLAVARTEFGRKELPELAEMPDIAGYDRILIGFPIWFGTCPMAVVSFLKKSSMKGKIICPFCTSGATGCDKATADLREAIPDADVRRGMKANKLSHDDVLTWLVGQEA